MRRAMEGLMSVAAAVMVGAILSGPALGQTYVYPSKGQSPQEQQKDQGECHGWATQQSGVNLRRWRPRPRDPQARWRGARRGEQRWAPWAGQSEAMRARAPPSEPPRGP